MDLNFVAQHCTEKVIDFEKFVALLSQEEKEALLCMIEESLEEDENSQIDSDVAPIDTDFDGYGTVPTVEKVPETEKMPPDLKEQIEEVRKLSTKTKFVEYFPPLKLYVQGKYYWQKDKSITICDLKIVENEDFIKRGGLSINLELIDTGKFVRSIPKLNTINERIREILNKSEEDEAIYADFNWYEDVVIPAEKDLE